MSEELKKEYECFGMGFVSKEKCGDCEIQKECQIKHDIDAEDWAYQSAWDRLYEPSEEVIET